MLLTTGLPVVSWLIRTAMPRQKSPQHWGFAVLGAAIMLGGHIFVIMTVGHHG